MKLLQKCFLVSKINIDTDCMLEFETVYDIITKNEMISM